jgi:hypothetical protein
VLPIHIRITMDQMRKLPWLIGLLSIGLILGCAIVFWPRDSLRSFSNHVVLQNTTSFNTYPTPPITPESFSAGSYWMRKTILDDVPFSRVELVLKRTYPSWRGWTWDVDGNGFYAHGPDGHVMLCPGHYHNRPSVSVMEIVKMSKFELWKESRGMK